MSSEPPAISAATTSGAERTRERIRALGRELGFQALGFAGTAPGAAAERLQTWLARGYQGEMGYMARHGRRRTHPAELEPGTRSVISVRMDYWPATAAPAQEILDRPERAYVARYALGRDYHKVLRRRLRRLAEAIDATIARHRYRVYTDSAPVMEKPLAVRAGLGWIGKHTNLIAPRAGSWFFLGEIYSSLELPPDTPAEDHCGRCDRCIRACPTAAIVAPYVLDARRCISYHTIELHGPIPEEFRPAIGNRVFGCDDCQLVCPWNRFARPAGEADFRPRHGLDQAGLLELFAWDEDRFLRRTEGSAIRRLGHERWLRNLAVGLGNGPDRPEVRAALRRRLRHPSSLVREHCRWALEHLARPRGTRTGGAA